MATNAAIDEVRRRARRPRPVDEVPDETSRPFEAVVEARMVVDGALRGLPPEFRAAVALRDLHDLDYAEIAEILRVPIGTVRSRIARGRAALAAALTGNQAGEPTRPTIDPP